MKRMLIAITPRFSINPLGMEVYQDLYTYFNLVRREDTLPVMMPICSEEEAAAAAELCTGLIITGGEDLDPAMYGEENTDCSLTDPRIDATDLYLYKAFRALGKPVLGICRGHQLIAVAEGGTLMQDIHKYNPSFHNHNQFKDPSIPVNGFLHDCTFVEGTRLYSVFGERAPVSSSHHRAVKKAPEGWTISAWSDDGLIEGMEKDNVIAVQWHPERVQQDERQRALGEMFLEDCRAYLRRP